MAETRELKEIGEFGLIDLIKTDTIYDPATVLEGIGDDAAVLLSTPRMLQLLTTDMLVENVHFDLQTTEPWQLGYKALAVNLSDIAAMGGIPRQAVISVGLPPATAVEFIKNLYQGMKEICREFHVNIVGGDTVSSPQALVINVAVLGEVEPARLVRRSGAEQGDWIVVTGHLGDSSAGLDVLRGGDWESPPFSWPLVTAHLTPKPQVQAGQILAQTGITSMNDISDGLASELNEIARASRVGLRVYAEKIPLSAELRQWADFVGKPAVDYALFGGEDYQLVCTAAPARCSELFAALVGHQQLTVIGEVVGLSDGVTLVEANGDSRLLAARGYNHFR